MSVCVCVRAWLCVCMVVCVCVRAWLYVCFLLFRDFLRNHLAKTRGGGGGVGCVFVCLPACVRGFVCVFLRSHSPTGSHCEKHHGEEEVCVCVFFFSLSFRTLPRVHKKKMENKKN